jgi:hypothetical protein
VFATWKLPQSLRALAALAKLKLSGEQLEACVADGSLKPNSTEADMRRLAAKFKPALKDKNQKQRRAVGRRAYIGHRYVPVIPPSARAK